MAAERNGWGKNTAKTSGVFLFDVELCTQEELVVVLKVLKSHCQSRSKRFDLVFNPRTCLVMVLMLGPAYITARAPNILVKADDFTGKTWIRLALGER